MKHLPLCLAACFGLLAAAEFVQPETALWTSGSGGYHTYRIPALLVSGKGTLLAFCEGRKNSRSDSGEINILLKRSTDRGATWGESAVIVAFGSDTAGNPAPVLDRKTGTIWLLLTRNIGTDTEAQIVARTAAGTRTVWVTHSDDDGLTWTKPVDITSQVKPASWTWYATGPGAGIQLRGGRLVIACDHITDQPEGAYSHVVFSDDHGQTWKLGGSAGPKANESTVVQLTDGRLLLNMRTTDRELKRRITSLSRDQGASWSEPAVAEDLIDPICEGSMIRAGKGRQPVLLFVNPASAKREHLTLKVSRDNGKTWQVGQVLHPGPAAYSSLGELPDKTIGVLYEAGAASPYETILFSRLPPLKGPR